MGWFSSRKDLSAREKSKALEKVLEQMKGEGANNIELRRLIAEAIGGRTGPDDAPVTSIMHDIVSYGLPSMERAKSIDLSGWWAPADAGARAKALQTTIECLK